ncbi:MAG: trimethylamine--corrinoid methyltransferase [Chloroflexi bacterium]|nr:MAG: trimethylamine--corrinoid methyltransferase [Chloroflexota bacterium]
MLHTTCEFLTTDELEQIHDASMQLLANVGVIFHADAALDLFRQHGVKVNGRSIHLTESQVMDAVALAPKQFKIRARNPAKSVTVGQGEPIFVPGYGAPFILDENGSRQPTLQDYENLIRLADALPNQDISGHLLVQPGDVCPANAHLHMLHHGMVYSDKPFMGSAAGTNGATHTMEMASILFDQPPNFLAEQPVTLGLIDTISPLQYGQETCEALITYAQWRQPLIIASLVMAGATGPMTLAGVIAQQNAEILAGIVLTQLINPGTPVMYGAASTIMDMRTGNLAIGGPEMALIVAASAQLARFYGLPSRGGGGVTDANCPDAQAGFESMLGLLTAVNSHNDLILHAAGILSSYLAFSYEKFVMDDEICGLVRHYHRGIRVSPETLAYDVIANVGSDGNFLEEAHTYKHFRTAAWHPALCDRGGMKMWMENGRLTATQRAHTRWQTLLANHRPPPLDKTTIRQLTHYIQSHTQQSSIVNQKS